MTSCSSIKRENPLDFGYDRQIVIDQHHIIVALLKSSPGIVFSRGEGWVCNYCENVVGIVIVMMIPTSSSPSHIHVEIQPWYVFSRVEGGSAISRIGTKN